MKILITLLLALLITYTPGAAHEDEPHQNTQQNAQTSSQVGEQASEEAENGSSGENQSQGSEQGEARAQLHGLTEHTHNQLVHFPIALSIIGLFFAFMYLKDPVYIKPLFITVAFATLVVVAAFFTGQAQEEPFEGGPKEWILETHETLGLITMLSYFGWLVFLVLRPLNKYNWIMGLITAGLAITAAFYGGSLAH